ncbi:protein FAM3D [Tachyglossus aculeatus]|uniref:protein FAM3D n=1 Tax=Tachyglossus aculeatus TaxID=9261 RepID=UPI0018F30371|nr:protein FAM3D [Tachyglossus aculeatus]
MRLSGALRILAIIFTLVTTWFFAHTYFNSGIKGISIRSWLDSRTGITKPLRTKCGNHKRCPEDFFAFRIVSGAANVVGPSLCFEDRILMSAVKNTIGRGLNIALVNGSTGHFLRHGIFDMYSGDINILLKFLSEIADGTLVLIASYDDPGTKLNTEARKFFTDLGSVHANDLGFRDSWVFLGAKGLRDKSPFEQFLKNHPENNKYDGWPEMLEMEGCVPRKLY